MPESPCVRNCCLDQHDCCLGCGRLLSEIIEWHNADGMRRGAILDLAAKRLTQRQQLYVLRHPAADPSE
ncbi:DUF1289 domain-containing protein [Rheinheimera oceanensis]|uniref:DUF1289 domain-containing protein n=1 Tax=Rheinheimera oceanensis TaxID=2817449 RepID=UPI001BFEC9F0|nr:DUF1289 domain-containing protein [Rheinheimera oceanensis]